MKKKGMATLILEKNRKQHDIKEENIDKENTQIVK